MEAKHFPHDGGRPLWAGLHPGGAAASGAVPEAVGPRESGVLAAAVKRMRALSLAVIRDAIAASRRKPYIEMVLRFVVHLTLRKRPKVFNEEDTCPIGFEEEKAKILAALIVHEVDSLVASSPWAYQAGSSAREAGPLMAMILDEARETTSRATLYKRERSNAYGTMDLLGVVYLLRREGVQPKAARLCPRYLQQVPVISITVAGVSRAWLFKIGVFQASPLSWRVYLYQTCIEAEGPEDTGFPPVKVYGQIPGGHGALLD